MKVYQNDVFIVCHSYELVHQLEQKNQFKKLKNYKYLLVGKNLPPSLENEKIIVCENLEENIEHLKNLLTFTAWYAISRNKLASSQYVTIFEYDVDIKQNLELNLDNFDMIGYIDYLIDSEKSFRQYPPYISEFVSKFQISNHEEKISKIYGSNKWACTTNFTIKSVVLDEFVDFYYDLILNENIYDKYKQAHIHERMITLFALIKNKSIKLEEGYLEHLGLISHGI